MAQNLAMISTTPLMRRSVSALVAGTFLLTACGPSGGSDDAASTTAASKSTTTVASSTGATSTTDADAGDGPTAAQLATILPPVAEIGDGWMTNDTPQSPDAAETATETECPDAANLLSAPADDEVTQTYTGPGQETVQVSLAAGVDPIDGDAAKDAAATINACAPVTATQDGLPYEATFDAKADGSFGEGGVALVVTTTIGEPGNSYELATYRLVFTVGSVGVTVTGLDGLAEDGSVSRLDKSDVEALATEMAKRVDSL